MWRGWIVLPPGDEGAKIIEEVGLVVSNERPDGDGQVEYDVE